MDAALLIIRTFHFAGALSLTGLFGFAALVAGDLAMRARTQLRIVGWISAIVLLLTAPVWLFSVAESMTGSPLDATIASGAPGVVLTNTQFGHVLALRVVLALLLLPLLFKLGARRALDLLGAVLATIGLAAIAWQGHAGADLGRDAAIHLAADTAHLIAAGLWLGGLVPLGLLLRDAADIREQYELARRFSTLGAACVAVLLLSGILNAWYLVGTPQALIGTRYGQTLLLKLGFVAAILLLASVNRWQLVPRLAARDGHASRRLLRHVAIEAALSLGVIAIVALLGTMIPAAHEQIASSFAERFGLECWTADPQGCADLLFGGLSALLGLGAAAIGLSFRYAAMVAIGGAITFGVGTHVTQSMLIPPTMTSYHVAPRFIAAPSIAALRPIAPVDLFPAAPAVRVHEG